MLFFAWLGGGAVLNPQFLLPLADELIVDLFAGGGGASTGIEQAVGRHVDIAVNHDAAAVSLHQANHPQTRHYVSDVFEVDPLAVTDGLAVGLLWASPDCRHFSRAKGGKPVSKRVRGLAWVVVKWARLVRPRIICLENVAEFQTWGPMAADDRPCPERKGKTFARWKAHLVALGYKVEHRELRACDYGAPTIRKRLFLVARRDGLPIVWPEPTHAANPAKGSGLQPWRTAAECIDWTLPCPSIFDRQRPLAEATLRRIAHGVMRYVVNAARPFIAPVTHAGVHSTAAHRGELALVSPTMVAAFLAKHYSGVVGIPLTAPLGTVTTQDHHSLVASSMVKLRGTSHSADTAAPLHTISAGGQHHAEVRAFLTAYYGSDQDTPLDDPMHTVTTKPRFGLVMVEGQPYAIADIGMRMLQPRELYTAQGFHASYVIDRGADGRVLPKDAQVRMCGNSVCPPLARALVLANYSEARALGRPRISLLDAA